MPNTNILSTVKHELAHYQRNLDSLIDSINLNGANATQGYILDQLQRTLIRHRAELSRIQTQVAVQIQAS